jgi:hypothetical protein
MVCAWLTSSWLGSAVDLGVPGRARGSDPLGVDLCQAHSIDVRGFVHDLTVDMLDRYTTRVRCVGPWS